MICSDKICDNECLRRHRVDDAVLAARHLGSDGLYLLFEPRFSSPDHARHAIDRIYDVCR
jgi:hypothetical protein